MYKKTTRSLVTALLVLVLVVAGCGGGNGDSSTQARVASGPAVQAQVQAQPIVATMESLASAEARVQDILPIKAYSKLAPPRPIYVTLAPLESRALVEQSASAPTPGQPIQIGAAREVVATAHEKDLSSRLDWTASAQGGKISALSFKSTGAKGVRLGVRVVRLPVAAMLRFHVPGSPTALEISSAEIMALIQRNLDAGDSSDEARTYWSPDLSSDEVTMEIELPAGANTESVQISVPRISHVFTQLPEKDAFVSMAGQSGGCNLDVSCDPAYDEESRSVARMRFVKSGNSYLCTGTLLNNKAADWIPYFLSAYHCISTQTVASTLTTDWFYRSSACNSGALGPAARTLTGGATLLYGASATDTSFMRLNSAPPAGVNFAGWSAVQPGLGVAAIGLHNPAGDLQKYSAGSTEGFHSCTNGSATFTCAASAPETANHLDVRWTIGTVEGGSSGSGLFITSNGKRYLIGQLHGGNSSCQNPFGSNLYGRFDIAYQTALSQWLSPAAGQHSPVYRFYNTLTGTHFYTSSAAERDYVSVKYPQFSYEGIAFYSHGSSVSGTSPVFRFYNTRTGTHFYTINPLERDNVLAAYPWFSYEGVSWYASTTPSTGATPLYRFYNSATGTHFYTVNPNERDLVVKSYPQFSNEGVAYYVWDAP